MPQPDDVDPIQDAKHARETAATRPATPAEALATWELAALRVDAARQEQYDANAAYVGASAGLAEAINRATGGNACVSPVLIGGRLVSVEFDDRWMVSVTSPAVLT